jgi:hypothetical protein
MLSENWPHTCLIAFGLVVIVSVATAKADDNRWTFDFGAGASPTTGDISSRLTTGWHVDFRGGYELENGFGLLGDFMYNGLGVADQVLQTLQVPDGNARMLSLTAGPIWRFPTAGKAHVYVLGGVGWYRRTVEFTQPTVGVIDVFDPWWGYVGPVVVQTNQVLGSVTKNAFGGNAGGGVSFPIADTGAEVFAEVRYHFANTKPTSTAIVPVSIGIHWAGGHTTTSRP